FAASQAGVDESEGDRVHLNVEGSPLAGQGAGESDDARFGRGVVGLAKVSPRRGGGTDVDDLARAGLTPLRALTFRRAAQQGRRSSNASTGPGNDSCPAVQPGWRAACFACGLDRSEVWTHEGGIGVKAISNLRLARLGRSVWTPAGGRPASPAVSFAAASRNRRCKAKA